MNDLQKKYLDLACLYHDYESFCSLPTKNRQSLEQMYELKDKIKELEDELKELNYE